MTAPVQTCYRHTDRRAGVSCQRCDRPICPHCMTQAAVGFHCPDCLRSAPQRVVRPGDVQRRANPVVTKVLIGLNVAVFFLGWAIDGDPNQVGTTSLQDKGDLFGPLVASGEWYRIVTSAFLHSGTGHIGLNMLSLWFIGSQLEPLMGRWRFLLTYAAGLVAGSLGALIVDADKATVGASGAIFGTFGAIVALQLVRRINIWQSGVGVFLVLNIAFSFSPGISKGGHFGGLAGGLVVGWIFFWLEPRLPDKVVPVVLTLAVIGACFAGAVAVAGSG